MKNMFRVQKIKKKNMKCFNELKDCNLNLYNVVVQNKQPSCAVIYV